MHLDHAFRRILNNNVELIQRCVQVEVETGSGQPTSFHWNGRSNEIVSSLGPFQGDLSDNDTSFLVTTATNEVFLLYATPSQNAGYRESQHSQWILALRILRDNELMGMDREPPGILGNEQLKRVSDYHGHICPDLVVGCKAVNVGLNSFRQHEKPENGLSIIVQNATSAVDAIQCLTGCTLGNQRLIIQDYGKHNYTFISHTTNRATEVRLRNISYPDQENFHELEKTLKTQKGTVHQIAKLRIMLDDWIKWLLSLADETVFHSSESCRLPPSPETFCHYSTCPLCGEPVLDSRTVDFQDQSVCLPCAHWNHQIQKNVTWH